MEDFDDGSEGRWSSSTESDSDFQDSDGESDEAVEDGDVLCEQEQEDDRAGDNEMFTKKMKNVHPIPDEEIYASDEPNKGSLKRIKTEHDLDNQTKNRDYLACPTITLSSEDEGHQDGELATEPSTVTCNLKVVFDVEYRAPY